MIPTLFIIGVVLVSLWGGNTLLESRAIRRMSERGELLRAKMLRHAPSGVVGRMLGIYIRPHRVFWWYRPSFTVQIIVCHECLRLVRSSSDVIDWEFRMMRVRSIGGVREYPFSELVAALPDEVRAFHEGGNLR